MRIVGQKRIMLTTHQAAEFYREHKDMPFFDSLVASMTAAPVVVQVLQGKDVVSRYRELMGTTDPKEAAPGTIRAEYGEDIGRNTVHGSESVEKAAAEISFFFKPEEILG